MIKKLIIFVFVGGLLLIEGFAQSPYFMKTYGTSKKDYGFEFIRTCDNGYVLSGTSQKIDGSSDAYILKIDSAGNEKWAWNIGFSGVYDAPEYIVETTDSSILAFVTSASANTHLRIVKLNYFGSVVFDSTYYQSDGFPSFDLTNGHYLNDGRIVTTVVQSDTLLKAYWWNQFGDTLFSEKINTYNKTATFLSINRSGSFLSDTGIVFYMDNTQGSNPYYIDITRTNFNGLNGQNQSHNNFEAMDCRVVPFIGTNSLLIFDAGINSTKINYSKYSILSNALEISDVYDLSPQEICSIDAECLLNDSIVFVGQIRPDSDTAKAYILKMDENFSQLFLKTYIPTGSDESYFVNVKGYPDCIAAIGTASNSTSPDSVDIFFLKANLNGGITEISEFSFENSFIKVFPNPASDLISVNLLPVGESVYTIVDAGGRELLKGKTQSNQITISSLPAGCYQLLWENDGKKYCAGFVKE